MAIGRIKLRLGDALVRAHALTEEQLERALSMQKGTGKRLGEVLVEQGFTTEEKIADALSDQLGITHIDLETMGEIPQEILGYFKGEFLRKNRLLPFSYGDNDLSVIRVAMADPLDIRAIDDVEMITGLRVETYVATGRSILLALDKLFGSEEAKNVENLYADQEEEEEEELISKDIENSPIVQLVKELIDKAVRQRASDIHIEPMEKQVRVRYRIDGALFERGTYTPKALAAIVARIKIIGGMDISEKRKPQDGRITQVVDHMEYDIRVSILPTVYGEKVVMRLTSKTGLTMKKSMLGFREEELKVFDRIISNPHGILLVTGPTGSGKSTTLYTALSELNREDVNIVTVEDPVEANVDGINQVHVNVKADLTFASALRSILRQDPDIIMIGEIRDTETAEIAVQASITGHLVVSTLHTNSAASTVTRLADMGIEPYLIADSTVGIIAQRLIRKLCPECKEAYEASEEEKELLGIETAEPKIIYRAKGCPKCDNTGFRGRTGVYEIMPITPELKKIISHKGDADAIKEQALKEGMNTLRMSATKYVLEGVTTVGEMTKVSFDV